MSPSSVAIVQGIWTQILPMADTFAQRFYERLFELDANLRALFSDTDWPSQRSKLIQAINLVVRSGDQQDKVVPVLQNLGGRHVNYGAIDSHYATVGKALITTLAQVLGSAWTMEAQAAWTEAYTLVADTMRAGAPQAEPTA
jgi:hemoglobin-like flavoprotein